MRVAVLLVLALGAGCLESSVTTCADGSLCPAGTVCSPDGCVLQEQLDACVGLADGASCTFTGTTSARCVDGVCVSFACGNDIVEADQGEVCDDGNTTSGDGCRADCQKVETCGDGMRDDGEACDDGNTNAADGCDACQATEWIATPVIGGNLPATSIRTPYPMDIAIDRQGNVFIADSARIRRVDALTGAVTTVAGTGASGSSGDGGPATAARIATNAVAVDGLGNLFLTQHDGDRIRVVDAETGVITTIAGGGTPADGVGDGGSATGAAVYTPMDVAVDGLGNLYVADSAAHRIRRVDVVTGVITTIAGTGDAGFSLDGIPAATAEIYEPHGVAVDADRNVYFVDEDRVRRIDAATGLISTVAGSTVPGPGGDGGAATLAHLDDPDRVEVDAEGHLYIADTRNARVRRVDAVTGTITTVAGSGAEGFAGDGGPATAARLWRPGGVAVDAAGNVIVADTANARVRRVDAITGVITTIAGRGTTTEDSPATGTPVADPYGVTVDGSRLFVSAVTTVHEVRLDTSTIRVVAGTGVAGYGGDGGVATAAPLTGPAGLDVAADGLVIADSGNHRVRRVDLVTGRIRTIAGTGVAELSGDDGLATTAGLSMPLGVAFAPDGTLYVADRMNGRVRAIDAATGVITTATSGLTLPEAVAVDSTGTVYIADLGGARIVRGDLTTVASLSTPDGLAVDGLDRVYVLQSNEHRISRVDVGTGALTAVAGTGASGFSGDGGPAIAATLGEPQGIAADPDGNLYIADWLNQVVRSVDAATGVITTVAGQIDPEGVGPRGRAQLADPRAIAIGADLTVSAGGASGTVQAHRHAAGVVEVVVGRYPQDAATGDLARFRDRTFGDVGGIAFDEAAGVIYLTETTADRVQVVTIVDPDDAHTWTIAPLDLDVALREPTGLFLDAAAQVLYVADTGNHVIRAVELATGATTTVAGNDARLGFFGDGGAATDALLFAPEAITVCGNGDWFVADTGNHRVRRVAAGTGVITTVLGDGVAASSGQGAPARDFPVNTPRGLACDSAGNLYVTSTTTVRQVSADGSGVVDGEGAVSTIYGAPPRDVFPASITYCLTGLAIVDDARLQIADACTGMVIELRRAPATDVETMCEDGFDDDGDGAPDCGDLDCDGTAGCEHGTEASCADGADNDLDAVTDCADDDCADAASCLADACDGIAACELPSELTCGDGLDNDADGAIDCADADCAGCELDCADGADDDGDLAIDCLDADCAGLAGCESEPNDLLGEADAFATHAVSGQVRAHLSPITDGDMFSFSAAGATLLVAETAANLAMTTCGFGDELQLFDATGGLVASDFASGVGACSRLVYRMPAGRTLRVRQPSASVSVGYVLRATTTPLGTAVAETEPNDDADAAEGPFSAVAYRAGTITPIGDLDVYEVHNAGAAAVLLQVDVGDTTGVGTCAGSIDPMVNVRDAGGAVLASNDDDGPALCPSLGYTLAPGATVFVEVKEFDDNAAFGYRLLLHGL